MKRIMVASLLTAIFSISILAQSQSRADLLTAIETKRADLAKLETEFLAPSTEDRAAYADFLTQPDTGLIRLLPREKFDSYANQQSGITIRGGGSYYSFVRLTHEFGMGVDIGLEQGYFRAGFGGADYGMLTKLEGAGLEEVSTELPGVMFLAKYKAVATEPEARIEQTRFMRGTEIDGIPYNGRVPVEIGATYLLRSISFDRSDVLVTLKVHRKDTDGSVIVAWKLLKKFPKPELARNVKTEQ